MLTFQRIFIHDSVEEVIALAEDSGCVPLNEQAVALFCGVEAKKEELDEMIKKHLKKWTIARISKVSLAVLRLAVYEMKYSDDISDEIAISEAVKIAQTFTSKEDVMFINGVLASISKGK